MPATVDVAILSAGFGDTTTAALNGAASSTLGLSDTNIPAGGALAEQGFVFFLLGIGVNTEGFVTLSSGAETVSDGIRTHPEYTQLCSAAVLNTCYFEASSPDGNAMRLGNLGMYPSYAGVVGGRTFSGRGRGLTPVNGGPFTPGTFTPLARPLACGDRNSGNKLTLAIKSSRQVTIEENATADAAALTPTQINIKTILTDVETFYVKLGIVFYGVQICMPDAALCGPAPASRGDSQLATATPVQMAQAAYPRY